MKHARRDYQRIQDPEGKIGEDEPVFLLRGQDACAPAAVEAWANLAEVAGADPQMVALARLHARRMREWQDPEGWPSRGKVPDL